MARAKKEVKEQELNSGNEFMDQTAGTDAAGTNPELAGEPGTPAPLALELADTVQPPQTDQETAGDGVPEPGGVLPPPQTDLEPGAAPPGAGEMPIASQTDLEAAGDGAFEPGGALQPSQTGLGLRKALKARRTKPPLPRLTLSSPKTGSECLAGVASA